MSHAAYANIARDGQTMGQSDILAQENYNTKGRMPNIIAFGVWQIKTHKCGGFEASERNMMAKRTKIILWILIFMCVFLQTFPDFLINENLTLLNKFMSLKKYSFTLLFHYYLIT